MTGYSPEFKISARLGYAKNLFVAAAQQPGQQEKFSATLLIPKSDSAAIAEIRKAAEIAATEEWKDKAGLMVKNGLLKSPLLDGDGPQGCNKKTGERRVENVNHFFIRASATKMRPPKLFGTSWPLQPAVEGTDLVSGCYVEAVINAWTWHNDQNGDGVSFNLVMMRMLPQKFDRLGGMQDSNPEDYFGKIGDAGTPPKETADGQGAAGLFA